MKTVSRLVFLIVVIISSGCSNDDGSIENRPEQPETDLNISTGHTFEWRLDSLPDNFTTPADVIDIDAFSATPELIDNLHAQGKIVIAYLSVGSVENFRPDAELFPQEVIGNVYEGFEDENWLDIKKIDLLAPLMQVRFDMIKEKGFDGLEPDNINGYDNNTGFQLTVNDCKLYCKWLIEEAHKRHLSIGQKNAEELVPDLVNSFNWMLSESAYAFDFYSDLTPYTQAGKAVFAVEYKGEISQAAFANEVCPHAQQLGFFPLLKTIDLDKPAVICD